MKKNNKILWTLTQSKKLFKKPFFELIYLAHKIHRKNFIPNSIQISTLLSIKTGLCPEDCKYCPQSSRYKTNIKNEKLLDIKTILNAAKKAKNSGASRFCMGAAWKNPHDRDLPFLESIIKKIKNIGLETCMTLGSLSEKQAQKLSKAGLDYYNHNLDTSANFYKKIVTTRTYEDRLKTLDIVYKSGMKTCSGGIIGLGETENDRASLLVQLSNLPKHPESIPLNMLVKVPGTPLEKNKNIDLFDFIRTIAVTRIMMPKSYIRLSAGRENMSEQTQAMCFMAGVNSLFYGCKLLTTKNRDKYKDIELFKKLNLHPEKNNIFKNNNIQEFLKNKKENKNNKKNFYNAI